jgi:hypothetical protein
MITVFSGLIKIDHRLHTQCRSSGDTDDGLDWYSLTVVPSQAKGRHTSSTARPGSRCEQWQSERDVKLLM